MSVTVADLFTANAAELGLSWITGRPGEAREAFTYSASLNSTSSCGMNPRTSRESSLI